MAESKNPPNKSKRTVLIAGGGTGGHIYPGVAIARALKQKNPDIDVHFVGANGGLEETIVPKEGFPLHLVPVGKLHKSAGLVTRLKTLFTLPKSLWVSACLVRRLKPMAVLGVGGFASGPVVLMAAIFGRRSLIWEPNAYPGMANRLLSRFVDECLLVFEEAGKYLRARRLTQSGLPVRPTMKPQPRDGQGPLRVLVFGGSQGAKFLNDVVSASVLQGGDWLNGIELVHQTGRYDYSRIKDLYKNAPANVQGFEYLHDMDARYAWADVIFCRAGASTVAEVCACQKAAVFVPLPTAADNHQQKNAEVLVRGEAAMMILQKELTPERFQSVLRDFRDNRALVRKFEENIRKFQFPNAAERIVERVMDGVQA